MLPRVWASYLKDAGSLGHALQYGGFIAVLEEDGSVVVNILHLDKYSGCACPPTACRTVVCVPSHPQTYAEYIYISIIQFYANFSFDIRASNID